MALHDKATVSGDVAGASSTGALGGSWSTRGLHDRVEVSSTAPPEVMKVDATVPGDNARRNAPNFVSLHAAIRDGTLGILYSDMPPVPTTYSVGPVASTSPLPSMGFHRS